MLKKIFRESHHETFSSYRNEANTPGRCYLPLSIFNEKFPIRQPILILVVTKLNFCNILMNYAIPSLEIEEGLIVYDDYIQLSCSMDDKLIFGSSPPKSFTPDQIIMWKIPTPIQIASSVILNITYYGKVKILNKPLILSLLKDSILIEGAKLKVIDGDYDITIAKVVPPGCIVSVTKDTKLSLRETDNTSLKVINARDNILSNTLAFKIAGLDEPLAILRETLLLPLMMPSVLKSYGIECPKGVLLSGPPGCGKTLLVRILAEEVKAQRNLKLITLNGASCFNSLTGETERIIREIFVEASEHTAMNADGISIIFMDEVDALCPKRLNSSPMEARVVAQLLTLMDGIESRGQVILIAATNRPNVIDPALRRPGRFDKEIQIDPPSLNGRYEILKLLISKIPSSKEQLNESFINDMAEKTVGFVGADLVSLVREATLNAVSNSDKDEILITPFDFYRVLPTIDPSSLRGYATRKKSLIKWSDIGGLYEVKKRLQQAVEWPIKYASSFEHLGLSSPKGILLYGPPGCSKTTLVRAVTNASNASFFSLSGANVYSPWIGDAEKIIRDIFNKARAALPAVIFFDEIDAMVGKRDNDNSDSVQSRILSTLLNEMDGIEVTQGLLIIGATNKPELIDSALLRPGRLETLLHVPPPDKIATIEILKIHSRNVPLHPDVNFDEISNFLINLTGAEIEAVVREATLLGLRDDINLISMYLLPMKRLYAASKYEVTADFSDLVPNYSGSYEQSVYENLTKLLSPLNTK